MTRTHHFLAEAFFHNKDTFVPTSIVTKTFKPTKLRLLSGGAQTSDSVPESTMESKVQTAKALFGKYFETFEVDILSLSNIIHGFLDLFGWLLSSQKYFALLFLVIQELQNN